MKQKGLVRTDRMMKSHQTRPSHVGVSRPTFLSVINFALSAESLPCHSFQSDESTFRCEAFYLKPTDEIFDVFPAGRGFRALDLVCWCAGEGWGGGWGVLNLTVIVPHYSDLSRGFAALCGLLHQTAVINSLSQSVSHNAPSAVHRKTQSGCKGVNMSAIV